MTIVKLLGDQTETDESRRCRQAPTYEVGTKFLLLYSVHVYKRNAVR